MNDFLGCDILRQERSNQCCILQSNLVNKLVKTFGELVVLRKESGKWLCQCSCGNERLVGGGDLNGGKAKSCGCGRARANRSRAVDHTGKIFGELTVLSKDPDNAGCWICQCSCGKETSVKTALLVQGKTQSCGCLKSVWCGLRYEIIANADVTPDSSFTLFDLRRTAFTLSMCPRSFFSPPLATRFAFVPFICLAFPTEARRVVIVVSLHLPVPLHLCPRAWSISCSRPAPAPAFFPKASTS